jgi:hypothetical protein
MDSPNIFIAHPTTAEQVDALKAFVKALKIKFEITNEKMYNTDFVAKIEKGRQDFTEGKGKIMSIDQLNDLWK